MKINFYVAVLFAFLVCSENAPATENVDSLKMLIQNAKHDTIILKAYLKWARAVDLDYTDSALVLWQTLVVIMKDLEITKVHSPIFRRV